MINQPQRQTLEQRLTRPGVLLTEGALGSLAEFAKIRTLDFNTLYGGIEGILLGVSPVAAVDFLRNNNVGRRVLNAAEIGAAVNGFGHYAETGYNTFLTKLDHFPVVGGVVGNYEQLPSYIQRAGDGALVGTGLVLTPWLLVQGYRSGLYGTVGNGARRAGAAVSRAYLNANHRLYNFVHNTVNPHAGPVAGALSGAAAVVGVNGIGMYALGRALNLL